MTDRRRAGIAIGLGSLWFIWGSTYLAIRVAVRTLPSLLAGSIRFLIAGVALGLWAYRPSRDDPIGVRQWRAATLITLGLLVFGNGAISIAARSLDAGVIAVLAATVPLWMAVLDAAVLRRRLRALEWTGILIGFGGIAALFGLPGGGQLPVGPAIVCLVGPFAWAISSLYARKAPMPRRALVGSSMQMLVGGALLGVIGLARGERLGHVSAESWLALGYLIVAGSIVAFTVYLWLLRVARTSLVSTYAYVNPVVAVVLGALVLHEQLTVRLALAGAVIVVGVALIVAAGRERPEEAP